MISDIPEIDIKKRPKEISEMGFIKSMREGNTGVGFTLETIMGIKENNAGEPDFTYKGMPFELKGQREDASSNVTLITKTPHWYPLSEREIIEKFGYQDIKGRQALKITLKATGDFNPKGFRLEFDEDNDRLNIVHKKGGIVCYFLISELMSKLKTKLFENLLLIIAERKKRGTNEYFHYKKAILLTKLTEDKFKEMLRKGLIVWEFRADIRERTRGKGDFFVRDHGPGFRLNRRHFDKLYEKGEIILDVDNIQQKSLEYF